MEIFVVIAVLAIHSGIPTKQYQFPVIVETKISKCSV